jgi:NAD(P)-dependent dehydrogenase (short-subunit alcohol dehydrogenase family)
VILVTGAARGIGAATARALAARGAHISAVGLEPAFLKSVTAGLDGDRHAWFEADVTDQAALDAAVEGTAASVGPIDAVVANAGVVSYGSVAAADPEAFARTVAVNLVGAYRTVAAAVPDLIRRRGYALLMSSVASFLPLPGAAAYAASKAGVESLARSLRLELARHGVAVGCAHPSWVDTDMVRDAERRFASVRGLRAALPWPLRRLTQVDACGAAIADAVARRARRVHVPRSAALPRAVRGVLDSRLAEAVMRAYARRLIPGLDEDVRPAVAAGRVSRSSR